MTNEKERIAILYEKALVLQKELGSETNISGDIIELIAKWFSDVRVMEGFLAICMAHATLQNKPLTMKMARSILKKILKDVSSNAMIKK